MSANAVQLRLVSGDKPAPDSGEQLDIERVFREHSAYVAAIGAKIIGRDEEVEDLVQDVFVEVHRGLSRVREAGALKGWLARITVRVAWQRLRKRKLRRLFGLADDTQYEGIADPSASPEQRVALSHLYRKLDGIPAAERIAWTLRHIQGESVQGIAELCNCSVTTVWRRVRAAEAHLESLR